MKRLILAFAALALTVLPAPPASPAAADGERLCRIYCEVMYLGCLVTGGRVDEELCDEWYAGCKDGCDAVLEPR